jgi:hypothetical protein
MTSGRKKYKIIKFEGVSYRYSFIFYLKSIEKLTVRNFIYLFDSIRILKKTNLFNSEYYLMNNPELEKVGINPYFHYLYYGGFKGANPSEYFDSALYLAKYSDVKFKTVNPLVHYIRYGHIESRLPHIEYRNRINNLANYKKEKQESYIKTRNRIKCLKIRPLFTVIIFFEENIRTLIENISSINNQSYNNWTMHILHESTLAPSSILKLVKPKLKRVIGFEKGSSFAIALKNVLESSVGDYVVLIRGKDLVAKNALLEYCEIINSNISDLIYSDEDYINENGIFINPNYKPDYSYDMLLSQNYFGYSSVISRKLMNQIELCECRSVESLYYDLYLQIAEKSETITHIPKILCHNRVLASSEKSVSNAKKV